MEISYLGVDLPLWLVLTTFAGILMYIYGTWPFDYFTKLGISGPKPLPFLGNFIDFAARQFYQNEKVWVKKFGKIYGYYLGRKPVLCIYDIDIIEQIMVKDFSKFCNRQGDDPVNPPMEKGLVFLRDNHWRGIRNIVLPSFSSGKLKSMFGAVDDCGKRLEEHFGKYAVSGEPITLKSYFGPYTLEVISATAFGLKIDAISDQDNPFLKHLRNIFEMTIPINYLVLRIFPFLYPIFAYFGNGVWPAKSIKFFADTVRKTVEERKADTTVRKDFLQLMLNAEAGHAAKDKESIATELANGNLASAVVSKNSKTKLTSDEIVAQSFIFFIAGYDSTATLMTFTLYLISLNPHCQDKIYTELMEKLGEGDLTYEKVMKLTYLEQCLNETLRMYPPALSMTREAKEDVVLGGYRIPKDTVIQIPFYYLHHDPEIYPDPEKYDPERFSAKGRSERNPAHFLGFGYGPRICIGNRLALLEAKVALAHILRKYEIVRCAETQDPDQMKIHAGPILTPVVPVKVGVKLRN